MRRFLVLLAVVSVSGCGEPKPSVVVDDPRAYLIEKLQAEELHASWEVYRNRDTEFVGQIVDEETSKLPNGLPTDSKRLDRMMMGLAMRYRLTTIKSEEQRALILEKAEARLAEPPMILYDSMMGRGTGQVKIALLDYDLLPGTWKKATRGGGMEMEDSPAVESVHGLTQEVFQAALKRLHEAYPDAGIYQIRCSFFYGSGEHRVLYQVGSWGGVALSKSGGRLFSENSTTLADLIEGKLKLADLDWSAPGQDNPGPTFYSPDRAALPSL